MNKRNIRLLYGFILITAVCFFVFYLFPKDEVKQHIIIAFNQAYPDYSLDFDRIKPALPLSLKLDSVTVSFKGDEAFNADYLKVGYPVSSLFGSGNSFSLKSRAYDGTLKGNVNIIKNESNRQIVADMRLSHIQIKNINAIHQVTEGKLTGLIEGTIAYDSTGSSDQATAKLSLTDGEFPLAISFIDLGQANFSEINIDATLNQQSLSVNQFTLKGMQIDGQLSGTITLKDPIYKSVLNLRGMIQLHPKFLQTLPSNLIPGKLFGKNGLPFSISGTFDKPDFSI